MTKKDMGPKILRILIEDREEDERVSDTNSEKGYISERYIAEKIHRKYDMGYKESAYQPMVNDEIEEMSGQMYKYDDEEFLVETETESGPGPNDRNIARAMKVESEE